MLDETRETLRRLAEATVAVEEVAGDRLDHAKCLVHGVCEQTIYDGQDCHGSGRVPDERFAALRGEHQWWAGATVYADFTVATNVVDKYATCSVCNSHGHIPSPYCLNATLDAVVDAAAACGLLIDSVLPPQITDTPEWYWLWRWVDSKHVVRRVAGYGSSAIDAAVAALGTWHAQQSEVRG